MNHRDELLTASDLSPALLAALAQLTPSLRDAWIDKHFLGRRDSYVRGQAAKANRALRERFGTVDNLREAA